MDPDKDMLALPAEARLGGPKKPSAPPPLSDAGWLQWPDDEDLMSGFGRTSHENVIKPCRALSCRYPVNGVAV